jgi:putative SOS response-associated peptidase YedK
MCGRYTLTRRQQEVAERFGVRQLSVELEPRFNIAPTQRVAVIRQSEDNEPTLDVMRWGLVPFWVTDLKSAKPFINARAETVASKPSFKKSLVNRRCIIPADGFYEWRKEGKLKIPMYIHSPDRSLIGFAGLWDIWKDRETGAVLNSCTIITTTANDTVSPVHDRMPVILKPEDESRWLDPSLQQPEEIMKFLVPAPNERLTMYTVSPKVNTWSVESPELIECVPQ